jgi:hypothetical protein
MYENQIEYILSRNIFTKSIFLGALAFDELIVIKTYPACLIINTEKRSSNKTGHWIAIYFSTNKEAFFFDSYGLSPSYFKLEIFIKNNSSSFVYNQLRIQGKKPYCGLYCVVFLIYKLSNLKFLDLFTNNLDLNDSIINKLFLDILK